MKTIFTLFIFIIIADFANAQTCNERYDAVNSATKKSLAYYDGLVKSKVQPNYIESFILYPVLKRKYINKNAKDTAIINRYEDLKRVVWCFDGLCLNNNKQFHLSKNEVISKIKSNEIADNYFRETVCALCTQYKLDSNQIKSILDFNDTTYFNKFSLLHKVLQLKNLNYNKCISNEIFSRYKTQLIDTIFKIYINTEELKTALQNNTVSLVDFDGFAEAVLMIALLDEQQNISDDLYDIVLKNQTQNGTWQIQNQDVKISEHATLVSLWLLMDYLQKLK